MGEKQSIAIGLIDHLDGQIKYDEKELGKLKKMNSDNDFLIGRMAGWIEANKRIKARVEVRLKLVEQGHMK